MLAEACFVIAEAGVNHDGDLDVARQLVDAAAAAGADAVKFQTFSAEELAAPDAPKPEYQRSCGDAGESQRALLRRLELGADDHALLAAHAEARGIAFLSTAYDEASVDLLARLGVSRFKIASGELTNDPLLRHVARCASGRGRSVILSTGMATLPEVEHALATLRAAGAFDVTLLHCTSSYPAQPAECNLRAMAAMKRATGLPVGYSDHTRGIEIACAAVALGATVVEKHFTLDRTREGPDHAASVEPAELAALVEAIRNVGAALGDGEKRPMPGEREARALARRGLVAGRDLPAGCVLQAEDLRAHRPAVGLAPTGLSRIVGRRLRCGLRRGAPLLAEHLGPRAQ